MQKHIQYIYGARVSLYRVLSLTKSQKPDLSLTFTELPPSPLIQTVSFLDVEVVGGGAMGDFMSSTPPFSSLSYLFSRSTMANWFWRRSSVVAAPIPAAADFTINPPSRNIRIVRVYGSLRFVVVPVGVVLLVAGLLFRSSLPVLLVVVAESLWGFCVFCFCGIAVCVSVLVVSMWVGCSGGVVGGVCGWLPFVAVVMLFVVGLSWVWYVFS